MKIHIDKQKFKMGDWVILLKPYMGLNKKDIYPVKVVSVDFINTQVGPNHFEKKRSVSTYDRGETYTIKCDKYRLATEFEIKKEKMKNIFRVAIK